MRKLLIILLVLAAIPLYVWDFYLLAAAHLKHNKRSERVAVVLRDTKRSGLLPGEVHFVEKGRSPFVPNKEQPKPVGAKGKNKAPAKPAAPVTPPPISINGIMWNASNPVAIINLPDGSSTVAKKGQILAGGIVVKTIEKNQVQVEFNGKSFWLKK
jgi:type II secretory pathway component PulC